MKFPKGIRLLRQDKNTKLRIKESKGLGIWSANKDTHKLEIRSFFID